MKMVKSLLLGTAAGLVAMAGAQAADLPVKAKPVQYVKICSLYGAGFYYIPGTDMCLKIGGWVRPKFGYGVNGSLTTGALVANVNTRAHQQTSQIVAAATSPRTPVTRPNTAPFAATSRSVVNAQRRFGYRRTPLFSANRAFIQFAGFTFGLSQSFFDFYSGAGDVVLRRHINPSEDTGDGG